METDKLLTLAQEEMLDLRLYQAGFAACEPLHYYGPVKRNHFLFHLIIDGKGTLQSTRSTGETVDYHLNKGSGFLIVPEQVNTYYADRELPWSYVWMEFDGLQAYHLLKLAGLSQDSPIFRTPNDHLFRHLQTEMMYLANNADQSPLNLLAHTYLAVDYLTKRHNDDALNAYARSDQRQLDYVLRAIEFIEYHYAEPISVEDIAEFCNLSRSYLGAVFKKMYSKSIQEFLINYRLAKATEMLRFSSDSIKLIAEKAGYANQLNFSRAFQKRFTMAPSEWRRLNRPCLDPMEGINIHEA
ncbi:AraC family transcriptional regulator [Lacticaseibacillus parakribbianus]|uniref:AraC family transcriptional regulator n=1 Tax=Lacticaseibacillus parakribbianus TaxID=2970927 RepID=UPI0021CB15E6|nr:AraC family transcriptional regulator [Lacticaseibacillus parakribbianus]